MCHLLLFFFFQAEDGIRDRNVTGVQTCALPIFSVNFSIKAISFLSSARVQNGPFCSGHAFAGNYSLVPITALPTVFHIMQFRSKIGRASCRERVWRMVEVRYVVVSWW